MNTPQVTMSPVELPVPDPVKGKKSREADLIEPEMLSRYLNALQALMIKSYVVMNHSKPGLSLKDFMNGLETNLIDYSLAFSEGNRNRAAMILGINPTTLCEKIKRFKLRKDKSVYKQYDIFKELMGLVVQLKNAGINQDQFSPNVQKIESTNPKK